MAPASTPAPSAADFVSALSELAGILYDILDIADRVQREKGHEREVNALEHFADGLITEDGDVRRTGPESMHRGDADLIYLMTVGQFDGSRVLEEAEREMHALRGTFRIIEPSTEWLSRFRGDAASSSIRGWVLPRRGWVFLISAPDEAEADAFADLLDAHLAVIERDVS